MLAGHRPLRPGAYSTHSICSHLHRLAVGRPGGRRRGRSLTQRTHAVGWDPEGLLRAPEGGHIARRQLSKQAEENAELQAELEKLQKEKEAELQAKREARQQPQTHAQVISYFLDTEAGEMQYETARLRPLLTPDFFQHLSTEISTAKFGASPNEDRIAELEGLRDFLESGIKVIDAKMAELSAPADRMKKLLTAPDKKAMLLEMAGNNEIDVPLLDLLTQNISAARAAGQEAPAAFMEKVRDAAKKFVLTK